MAEDDDTPETEAEGEDGAAGGKVRPAAIQKKVLVDAVATASGVKRKTVKPVVEAILIEIAAALSDGKSLILPPLGRIGVNRSKGDVMILKLKRSRLDDVGVAGKAEDMSEADDEVETAE